MDFINAVEMKVEEKYNKSVYDSNTTATLPAENKVYNLARLTYPDSIKKNANVEEEEDKNLENKVVEMTKRKVYSLSHFTYPTSDNMVSLKKKPSAIFYE